MGDEGTRSHVWHSGFELSLGYFSRLAAECSFPPQEIKKNNCSFTYAVHCSISFPQSLFIEREEQKKLVFPHARCTPFIFEFPRLIPADSVHILHLQSLHLESQSSILPQGEPQRLRRKQEHFFAIRRHFQTCKQSGKEQQLMAKLLRAFVPQH